MRDAADEMTKSGDKNVYVLEGLDFFGEGDKALFHDSLHPNDKGCELMANRLLPTVKRAVH
jgi:lysophospholipase L1-like esterase